MPRNDTKTLIRNATVVTLDDSGSVLHGADVLVHGEHLVAVGEVAPSAAEEVDEVVDASGCIVMPGLVNSHCHSPMTLQRGAAEDLAFPQWLPRVWRIENALEAEDYYWGAALAAVEMIKTGTVAFNDMYFAMDNVAAVVLESGLKASLGATLFDPGEGSEVGEQLDEAVAWNEEVEHLGEPRLRTYLAPHSPYTCSVELLEQVVEQAHATGAGIHFHLSEDQHQYEDSMKRHGKSPVQLADALGIFDVPQGCVAAHTLMVDPEDVAVLAEKGVRVPHCPITYAKLAMEMFPLTVLREAGVTICLGTDGPASNADMDLFAVVRQTALLQKYLTLDPEALGGDVLLRMATHIGAAAIGFPQSGRLVPGAAADLILLDARAPHLVPCTNVVANLVHSAKGSDVTHTMVDGNWLMRDRELLTLDEERIVAQAGERGQALLERAGNA